MNLDEALAPMERLAAQAIALAPRIALVLLVLLIGLLLSSLAGRVTRWAVRRTGVEALSERFGMAKILYAVGIKRGLARMLGTLVWVSGLLLTLSSAAELLGLPGMAQVTSAVVGVLPRFVIATAIAAVGFVVADLLRGLVRRASRRGEEVDSPELAAQLVYYGVLVVALTTSLEHAGIETGLIDSLVQITVGAAALSVALAFALGSRNAFRNLVARHYVSKMMRPGDEIDVAGTSGKIVRFGPASVLIETANGEAVVPCDRLFEQEVVIRRPKEK